MNAIVNAIRREWHIQFCHGDAAIALYHRLSKRCRHHGTRFDGISHCAFVQALLECLWRDTGHTASFRNERLLVFGTPEITLIENRSSSVGESGDIWSAPVLGLQQATSAVVVGTPVDSARLGEKGICWAEARRYSPSQQARCLTHFDGALMAGLITRDIDR